MKTARITLWINLIVQTVLGLIMLLLPILMSQLIFVPVPSLFIQAIGSVALSISLLCLLTLQKTNKKIGAVLAFIAIATLALFNLGLALFLGIAAIRHLLSWLGLLVHLPLAVLCIYSLVLLNNSDT